MQDVTTCDGDDASSEAHWGEPCYDLQRRAAHDVLHIKCTVEQEDSQYAVGKEERENQRFQVGNLEQASR